MIYGNMKEHKYEVEGIKPQIMTEVSTLLHVCYEKGLFDKDDMNEIVKFACMSKEDVHDEAKNKLDSLMPTVLDKMFDDATHGKQEAIDALSMLADMMLKDMSDKEQKNGTNE